MSGERPFIIYHTDGKGRWVKNTSAEQCNDEELFGSCCQGVKGHKGNHWAYKPNGSLYQWRNDNDPDAMEEGIASAMTPPDHKSYIAPIEKHGDYYIKFNKHEEITDPDIISALEAGNPPESWASIDKPCTPQEVEILKNLGRI